MSGGLLISLTLLAWVGGITVTNMYSVYRSYGLRTKEFYMWSVVSALLFCVCASVLATLFAVG